jgi:arabinogalactan oligomer/maltooligosaccharide transport system permease protein
MADSGERSIAQDTYIGFDRIARFDADASSAARDQLWHPLYYRRLIVFAFVPVVWVLSASLNQSGSLVSAGIIPRNAGLQNYQNLVENPYYPFLRWLYNSFVVASISTFLSVSSTAIAAYAFSRFRFYGRRGPSSWATTSPFWGWIRT